MEKKKISMFPSPEDMEEEEAWGELFRNRFSEDSKKLEHELEREKEIRNIDASPELFERIVAQLKREGKWEEDAPEEKGQKKIKKKPETEKEKEKTAEQETSDLRFVLPKKDWEALQLGRKIQEQGKRRRLKRFVQMAATVALCVFAVSMSSEANRQYIMSMVNTIIGSNPDINDIVLNRDKKEWEAYEELEEKLGIPVPRLKYTADGMTFDSYSLGKELRDGSVFYRYGEMIITLCVHKREGGSVMAQTFVGELSDEFRIKVNGISVQIYETVREEVEHSYVGELEYEDGYYVLMGNMEREEFLKVVQGLAF